MRTRLARFPFVKSLETFDFSYQPSLDKKQIQTLATCHFLEHGENVVLLGPFLITALRARGAVEDAVVGT
jgi:DNA replication protein DnaC